MFRGSKRFLAAAFTVLALSSWASVARAQDSPTSVSTNGMPECALGCLLKAIPSSGCEITDQKCICESKTLTANVTACVEEACTVKEALRTLNATQTSCNRPVRDRSHEYITINNTFVIISAIFVIQRFGYKLYARLDLGLDDWFTLGVLVFGIPSTIINARYLPANGMGQDIWTLTPEQITSFGRFFYVQEIIYFTAVWLAKLALLFFYLRIFPSNQVRRVIWGTVVFNLLFGCAFSLVAIFQCRPVQYFWVMWDKEHQGTCININAMSWSNAIISIALDLWMLCIPLWQLRSLKLGWKKKLGVGLMFSVGLFVTIVSILRLKSLLAFTYKTANPTWDFFDVGIWSDVEINVSMICVCLPSLRLLLVTLFPKLRETTSNSYHNYRSRGTGAYASRSGGGQVSSRARGADDETANGAGAHDAPNKIWYQKSFTVKYLENDEINLVSMKDHDGNSAKSEAT